MGKVVNGLVLGCLDLPQSMKVHRYTDYTALKISEAGGKLRSRTTLIGEMDPFIGSLVSTGSTAAGVPHLDWIRTGELLIFSRRHLHKVKCCPKTLLAFASSRPSIPNFHHKRADTQSFVGTLHFWNGTSGLQDSNEEGAVHDPSSNVGDEQVFETQGSVYIDAQPISEVMFIY